MGSCSSVHRKMEPDMKFKQSLGSKAAKLVIPPSPMKEKPYNDNFPIHNITFKSFKITSTLTFVVSCASAGIIVLIGNDLNDCTHNYCSRFEIATTMVFMSWFAASPSFLLNFWTLATK